MKIIVYTLAAATTLIVAVQISCTWVLVHEARRNYQANIVQTYKACGDVWNPWERAPWESQR